MCHARSNADSRCRYVARSYENVEVETALDASVAGAVGVDMGVVRVGVVSVGSVEQPLATTSNATIIPGVAPRRAREATRLQQ